MAGAISGLGTNYNLPNYTGVLFQLTPADTPLFSAIGGLAGGGQTTSTEFEWETFDLRNPSQPAVVEGADAPTAASRVRGNVTNVVQIHQEQVSIAYSKLAAFGQKSGTNNDAMNPIRSELDWQVEQMLKQMVRDVEYSFINGAYQKPSDNNTGRKTRGLLAAVSTNSFAYGTTSADDLTATASTDVINETGTGRANGDSIVFTAATGAAGITVGQVYYVVSKATDSFKVSLTKGGAAVDITSDGSAMEYTTLTGVTKAHVDDLLQSAYDNGGLTESSAGTLIVNSTLKRGISEAYSTAGQTPPDSRTVGGVAVDTIVTDFGVLNVMLNRYMPKDTILVASLEQLRPVFLEVPGKGHFFAEPLAKTGASDKVQLYGEVGLAYGNEAGHAKATGLGR